MLRLGYACINQTLQERENITVNRSCIAKTFEKNGKQYVVDLGKKNLENLIRVLEWNNKNNIQVYRMSSSMFPHITNPQFTVSGDLYSYDLSTFSEYFDRIGDLAFRYQQRLTFHPGQFNQIGTLHQNVFEKTKTELSCHADILDKIGCDYDSVMVIHGGGVYGNKEKTMSRWVEQFWGLPENVRNRLVIENCERQYNYRDVLRISKLIDRPVVFDVHHHWCYSQAVEKLPEPETFMSEILQTWHSRGLTPKIHVSDQAPGKRLGAHADYVQEMPKFILDLVADGQDIDVMVEAKCKEKAVLCLKSSIDAR